MESIKTISNRLKKLKGSKNIKLQIEKEKLKTLTKDQEVVDDIASLRKKYGI